MKGREHCSDRTTFAGTHVALFVPLCSSTISSLSEPLRVTLTSKKSVSPELTKVGAFGLRLGHSELDAKHGQKTIKWEGNLHNNIESVPIKLSSCFRFDLHLQNTEYNLGHFFMSFVPSLSRTLGPRSGELVRAPPPGHPLLI